jgi:hypothetical protein
MDNTETKKARGRRVHTRIMLWSLLLIAVGAMVAPLSGYLFVEIAGAQSFEETNPRSETTWRDVREGNTGITTIQGDETGVLIQNGGENWRQLRNGVVANIMPWVLFAALAAITGVFHRRANAPRSSPLRPSCFALEALGARVALDHGNAIHRAFHYRVKLVVWPCGADSRTRPRGVCSLRHIGHEFA